MEQIVLPSNPALITKEVATASFNVELTRLKYQEVLQAVENVEWTEKNINEDLLAPARLVASKLTDKKDQDKRPIIDAGKVIQNAYNEVFNPLNDAISRKTNEKKLLAEKIQREIDLANRERQRVADINTAIFTFIAAITNEITEADTDAKIVLAEKKIGSEGTRKNVYQEFVPQLKDQCEELKPLIKKQKEFVKALAEAEKAQKDAMAKGDDSTAVEMRTKAEELKDVIDENKIRLQQKAFEQIEESSPVVGMPTAIAPNASRTMWKWRVDDVKTLFKKNPELVDLIPNKEKVDQILRDKKESGELDGKSELSMNGITFYQDKSYK